MKGRHRAPGRPRRSTALALAAVLAAALLGVAGPLPTAHAARSGFLDPAFGRAGIARIELPGADNAWVDSMAVQPDGRVLVAGTLEQGDGNRFAVARYLTDGSPDPSFGEHGLAVGDLAVIGAADGPIPLGARRRAASGAHGLVLTPEGTILITGTVPTDPTSPASPGELGVLRLTGDGHRDPSFGRDGLATVTVGAGLRATGTSLLLGRDGRIVVGAHVVENPFSGEAERYRGAVAEFTRDGRLVPTSAGQGVTKLAVPVTGLAPGAGGCSRSTRTDG